MKQLFIILFLIGIPGFFSTCSTGKKEATLLKKESVSKKKYLRQTMLILADDQSEEKLGPFPWPRSYLAKILQRLEQSRLVIIDFTLDRTIGRQPDRELIRAIRRSKKIILLARLHPDGRQRSNALYGKDLPGLQSASVDFNGERALVPYLQLTDIVRAVGFAGIRSRENVPANFPLAVRFGGVVYPTIALAVLQQREGLVRRDFYLSGNSFFVQLKSMPVAKINNFPNAFIDYEAPSYSFSQVLLGDFDPVAFKNKIVIISYNFSRLQGYYFAGKRVSPGAIQAQRIESLLRWYESNSLEK